MRIVAVTAAEKPELWRHLQDYMRELLPYGGQLAPADGDLPYGHFDAYWREPETRWPFWGMRDHRRAGFAFVRKESGRMEMAEFYCFPQFRRTGVGLAFARKLLSRFPGPWEITQFAEHAGAVRFWRRVLADTPFEESRYVGEQSGQPRLRQRFVVPR